MYVCALGPQSVPTVETHKCRRPRVFKGTTYYHESCMYIYIYTYTMCVYVLYYGPARRQINFIHTPILEQSVLQCEVTKRASRL